jgi:Transcription factor Tfb2 (p52) C-terminal domain
LVKFDLSVLLEVPSIQSSEDFDRLINYAIELGGCLWHSFAKRIVIVNREISDEVISFSDSMIA